MIKFDDILREDDLSTDYNAVTVKAVINSQPREAQKMAP